MIRIFKVVINGFGIQGQLAARTILRKRDLELVAVSDVNPTLIGKDIGEIIGVDKTGIAICDPKSILRESKADVLADTTARWSLNLACERIFPFIEAGVNIVSTNAEMAYPWARSLNVARQIDDLAKKHDVTVVGTGICPGFVFSVLPLALTSSCLNVSRIRMKAVYELSDYPTLPTWVGFGLSPDDFKKRVEEKKILFPRKGVYDDEGIMVADCMGWKIDKVIDAIEPIVSKSRRNTVWGFMVAPGTTAGWKQTVTFLENREERIRLEYYGLAQIADEDRIERENTVWIDGEPEQVMVTKGGVITEGSLVTSLRLVNIIPQVVEAPAGLLSVKDIPSGYALPEKR